MKNSPFYPLVAVLSFFLLSSCNDETPSQKAEISQISHTTVSVNEVSRITASSAEFSAVITGTGNGSIKSKGFCLATDPKPSNTQNSITVQGSSRFYAAKISNLTPGSTYYVRAFVENENGIHFSESYSFMTADPEEMASSSLKYKGSLASN